MGGRIAAAATTLAVVLTGAVSAQAATPQLTVSAGLQDRRAVAAGQRSYIEDFADGRFYANGFHITGEMGGVWAPPVKLLDGIWFGLDGTWLPQARSFTSGWGYTRYSYPTVDGLTVSRLDFAPDARRAGLFRLTLTNPGAARTVTVTVDAHSELMGAYPWGTTTPISAAENLPDQGRYDGQSLVFTEDGALPPAAPVHHYAALVGSSRTPVSGVASATGGAYRGPQGATTCAASDSTSLPSACDDGPYGKGTGGELRYSVNVPAHGTATFWAGVGGSDAGLADARSQLAGALQDPSGELAAKLVARRALAAQTVVSLPGDRLLQKAITWGKQNLADLTQTASNLQIRWTSQGKQFPAPLGTVAHVKWFGAGFPDYPWIFATDGEYMAFPAVALGQFSTIKDHLVALRAISDILNHNSGIVVHETVSDGSVYFGHDSQSTGSDGTVTNDFNTDETVKFPSALALIWRWTGDNAFLRELYPFAVRNLRAVAQRYSDPKTGFPLGSGNVERPGMGPIKLDNAVYYIRGLYDLADMARFLHHGATASWANHLAARLRHEFEGTWWDQPAAQYADSLLTPSYTQSFQKHWIGVVPMEAALTRGTNVTSGLATPGRATTALAGRQSSCYSGERPGNLGLFHTGCGGGADGKGDFEIFSLTSSIMAVGEGNYGRLGASQQRRYTDANAETMFSEPTTGGTPDEQPGAMPEIFPSAPQGNPATGIPANINRCWTCRSMVMQGWGNYGTVWPVVSQQLGVRPFIGQGALEVIPQVPPGQPSVAGSNIHLGGGALNELASHSGSHYTTRVLLSGLSLRSVRVGSTLPARTGRYRVTLDGRRVRHPHAVQTNRGLEVTVSVRGSGPHTVDITAG